MWTRVKIGDFLRRRKDAIEIQNSIAYKRITIKTKHQGIHLRDELKGSLIGTKLQFGVKAGQFLLSKIDARLGAFGIVPKELDGSIITGNFWAFNVDKKRVNIKWFNLFTSSGNFYEICDRASSGTTHRKYLDETKFLGFEIDLPELEEQNEFIEKYDSYFQKHKNLESEIKKQETHLQQLRQAILQEAVQGKLTKQEKDDEPADKLLQRIKAEKQKLIAAGKLKKEKELPPITEDEIPFELPNGWVWCRLGEIIYDLKYGTSQKCDYKKAKHAVLRIPNVSNGKIELDDLKFANLPEEEFSNLKLEIDDLLVIRSNGSENLVGRTAAFKGAEFSCAYAGYLVRLRFNTKLSCTDYIHQVLESKYLRDLIEYPLRTTSGVKNINSTEISNLITPIPPLTEQHRIVAKVQQLMQMVNQLEQQVQQSKEQAQQLLQAVLKEAFSDKGKEYQENDMLTMAAEK